MKLRSVKEHLSSEYNELLDEIKAEIACAPFVIDHFDDILSRKVIECVKVLSKDEIAVIFKGGNEIRSLLE